MYGAVNTVSTLLISSQLLCTTSVLIVGGNLIKCVNRDCEYYIVHYQIIQNILEMNMQCNDLISHFKRHCVLNHWV